MEECEAECELRAAVIDVGTNSIKLLVGERSAGGAIKVIRHASHNARLGEGVDEARAISPRAADRAVKAICRLLDIAREYGDLPVRIIGTSAMRDAENRDELIARVRRKTGSSLKFSPKRMNAATRILPLLSIPRSGIMPGARSWRMSEEGHRS